MIELKLMLSEAEVQELEAALLIDAVRLQLMQQEDASPYHVVRAKTLETLTVKFLAATAA